MAAILRESVDIIVRTRAKPLAVLTTRKSIHGFTSLSYLCTGLRWAALWATVARL